MLKRENIYLRIFRLVFALHSGFLFSSLFSGKGGRLILVQPLVHAGWCVQKQIEPAFNYNTTKYLKKPIAYGIGPFRVCVIITTRTYDIEEVGA